MHGLSYSAMQSFVYLELTKTDLLLGLGQIEWQIIIEDDYNVFFSLPKTWRLRFLYNWILFQTGALIALRKSQYFLTERIFSLDEYFLSVIRDICVLTVNNSRATVYRDLKRLIGIMKPSQQRLVAGRKWGGIYKTLYLSMKRLPVLSFKRACDGND